MEHYQNTSSMQGPLSILAFDVVSQETAGDVDVGF